MDKQRLEPGLKTSPLAAWNLQDFFMSNVIPLRWILWSQPSVFLCTCTVTLGDVGWSFSDCFGLCTTLLIHGKSYEPASEIHCLCSDGQRVETCMILPLTMLKLIDTKFQVVNRSAFLIDEFDHVHQWVCLDVQNCFCRTKMCFAVVPSTFSSFYIVVFWC